MLYNSYTTPNFSKIDTLFVYYWSTLKTAFPRHLLAGGAVFITNRTPVIMGGTTLDASSTPVSSAALGFKGKLSMISTDLEMQSLFWMGSLSFQIKIVIFFTAKHKQSLFIDVLFRLLCWPILNHSTLHIGWYFHANFVEQYCNIPQYWLPRRHF